MAYMDGIIPGVTLPWLDPEARVLHLGLILSASGNCHDLNPRPITLLEKKGVLMVALSQ